jgi:hypothetical protein
LRLLIDVDCATVPFVPAAGNVPHATKLAKFFDKASDAGGAANKIDNATDLAKAGDNAASGVDNVAGAASEGRKISNDDVMAPPSKRGNAPTGSDGKPVKLHFKKKSPRHRKGYFEHRQNAMDATKERLLEERVGFWQIQENRVGDLSR